MSAADVLAQHRPVHDPQGHINGTVPGSISVYDCACGDPYNVTLADCLAHQLDALKAAGYAVVELPDPDVKNNRPLWGVLVCGEPEDVYVRPSGEVVISGAAVLYDDESRRLGEVLLAAANAAEAQS